MVYTLTHLLPVITIKAKYKSDVGENITDHVVRLFVGATVHCQ